MIWSNSLQAHKPGTLSPQAKRVKYGDSPMAAPAMRFFLWMLL